MLNQTYLIIWSEYLFETDKFQSYKMVTYIFIIFPTIAAIQINELSDKKDI